MPDHAIARTPRAPCFSWLRSDAGGVVRLTLAGELDAYGTPDLAMALERAQFGSAFVVVDMRRLTFLDCGALHVLLEAAERAREADTRFVVVRGPRQVERLFEIVDTGRLLERADLDESSVLADAEARTDAG